MPDGTILSLEVDNQEIPVLFAEMVKNGRVMDHPAVEQHQKVRPMVLDEKIRFMVPPEAKSADLYSEVKMTHAHVLSALADRAAKVEQTIAHGPIMVRL